MTEAVGRTAGHVILRETLPTSIVRGGRARRRSDTGFLTAQPFELSRSCRSVTTTRLSFSRCHRPLFWTGSRSRENADAAVRMASAKATSTAADGEAFRKVARPGKM